MFTIGRRAIGTGKRVFIVAEVSGNHNGDINRALAIIDAAADAGADAVKLQTYTPDTMTIKSTRPEFFVRTNPAWRGKSLYELYEEAYTPWEWHARLFEHAHKRGLICFSTPFDETAVDFLEKLHMPVYKVASFEVIDIPLLEKIGKTKKPVIMSRGMATQNEIREALTALRRNGAKNIVLLHCISAYPAAAEEMNLATISDMHSRFKVDVGLSDHNLSSDVAVAAVTLGACVVEKHLTLKRSDGGPDAAFSLEPQEFKALVESIRRTEAAIGTPSYARNKNERENVQFRRSLYVVEDIGKGERLTPRNVRSIRPGNGLPPREYHSIIGKRARKDIARGTPLSRKLIAR